MDQNQRQNNQSEPIAPARNIKRITRGFSDLPKQLPKPQSSSESDQELSQSTPKVKKIHHMTIKKLQRLEKLAEMERLGLIPPTPKIEKLPPRKRGRPKGTTKKVPVESEIESFKEPANQGLLKIEKKDFLLRKRENGKRMVEESSEEILEEKNQLKSVEIQIIVPEKPVERKVKQRQEKQEKQEKQQVAVPLMFSTAIAPTVPNVPKKRGRKKKVQPQPQQVPPAALQNTVPKVFTVPKAQTYDNYNKFYVKLLAETKEAEEKEVPLIFDKFSDPQGYKAMLAMVGSARI